MPEHPSRARVALAFAAVYLIWGSTYLAIRVAIDSVPPFVMAGIRFVIAGLVLLLWARGRGAPAPTRRNWVGAAGTYPGRRVMRQPRRVAATPVIPFGAPPLDPLVLLDGRE